MVMSEPEYLPNRMRSPALTSGLDAFARLEQLPAADGLDGGLLGLLFGAIGNDDPALALLAFFQSMDENTVV